MSNVKSSKRDDSEQSNLVRFDNVNSEDLNYCHKISFGLGHIYNDLCASMWFSYTLLFLQSVLHLEATTAGSMMLLGQVMDALATPVIGVLADRWGSKRSWHIMGSGLVVVSFPLIFSRCLGCWLGPDGDYLRWWQPLYYGTVIVVFQCGWAIVQISHLAMIPALTDSSKGRSELTAIRYTASVCSGVTVYVITWSILHTNGSTQTKLGATDDFKFRDIALILSAIGCTFSVLFHIILRKKLAPSTNTDSRRLDRIEPFDRSNVSNEQNTKNILLYPLLYQVALLYVASRLFSALSLVYVPLYLNERLSSEESTENIEAIASVPLVSYISSFFSSILLKMRSSKINHKVLYTFGSTVSIAACIWIAAFLMPSSATYQLYIIAALLGVGSSMTMVTSLCIAADFIGSRTDKGAIVYSVVTFADKLITGVAVIVIENLKCSDRTDCPDYYRMVLAYVCGGSATIGASVLLVWELCRSTCLDPRNQYESLQ